jgi:3-oxoacyl-(acyl-carrier-protein) synthase
MARFAQYAMVASEEALNDAGWLPEKEKDLEATVRDRSSTSRVLLIYPGRLHGLRYWKLGRCV